MNVSSRCCLRQTQVKYIGNTKLCCSSCAIAVDAVKRVDNLQDDNLRTAGRHQKAYVPWPVPDFITHDSAISNEIVNTMEGILRHELYSPPQHRVQADARRLSISQADAVVAALQHAAVRGAAQHQGNAELPRAVPQHQVGNIQDH